MSVRIIPVFDNKVPSYTPTWLNGPAVIMAGQKTLQQTKKALQTTAGQLPQPITTHYACVSCGNRLTSDNPGITSQFKIASNQGKELDSITCPRCHTAGMISDGQYRDVIPERESRTAAIYTDVADLKRTPRTYNTFTDRIMSVKAQDAITNYAAKKGMPIVRARLINSYRDAVSTLHNHMLDKFDFELEWNYGRNQKARVTATIGIDPASGKFIFPTMFKTADHQLHEFTKDNILGLEKAIAANPAAYQQLRKSDQPQYRKQDISRYRVAAKNSGKLVTTSSLNLTAEDGRKKTIEVGTEGTFQFQDKDNIIVTVGGAKITGPLSELKGYFKEVVASPIYDPKHPKFKASDNGINEELGPEWEELEDDDDGIMFAISINPDQEDLVKDLADSIGVDFDGTGSGVGEYDDDTVDLYFVADTEELKQQALRLFEENGIELL